MPACCKKLSIKKLPDGLPAFIFSCVFTMGSEEKQTMLARIPVMNLLFFALFNE